jgi:hypothetical protein
MVANTSPFDMNGAISFSRDFAGGTETTRRIPTTFVQIVAAQFMKKCGWWELAGVEIYDQYPMCDLKLGTSEQSIEVKGRAIAGEIEEDTHGVG